MYNYVVFGITNDFYEHSFADLKKMNNVLVRKDIYENNTKIIYYLYRLHTFPRTRIKWPFTSIWDKRSYRNTFKNNNRMCFVFMPKHANRHSYFKQLRDEYPDCKLVMMFRDRVDRNIQWFPYLKMEELKMEFDVIYSYNKYDCEKYGLSYFNTEASKEDLIPVDMSEWSDVVFVGYAKDRLDKIIRAYNIFKNAGLKTDFYVVGAPKKDRFREEGIVFSDKKMSYSEMLKRTINSKCVFEVSQSGEYGFTSRSQEAIMYNKKLITDSLIVKEQRFYPSRFIQFYDSIGEIDPSFVRDSEMPNYGYEDEYSPIRVIHQIESVINKE